MTLDDVVKKLNKNVLLNEKIPKDLRMLQTVKLSPDKKIVFSEERMRVAKGLLKGRYKTSEQLREDLKKISFDLSWTILTNCNFTGLDFSNVNFSVADLSNSSFSGCSMNGSDLSLARLTSTDFSGANLRASNLSMTDCGNASFRGANLSMCNFVSCIAVNANFMNSDLSHADFFNSNLRNARFEGANTAGINLEDCILAGTVFERFSDLEENKGKYQETFKEIYEQKSGAELSESAYSQSSVYTAKSHYKRKNLYG